MADQGALTNGQRVRAWVRVLGPALVAGGASGLVTGGGAFAAMTVHLEWLRDDIDRVERRIEVMEQKIDNIERRVWQWPEQRDETPEGASARGSS